VDATDLASLAEHFGKSCWYKDPDGDGYSDGTKVWALSRPMDDYYLAGELTTLWGDPDDYDAGVIPPVWEGDYSIESQDDLDNLSGYVEVTGSLSIRHIRYLYGLELLTSVGGSLDIADNDSLTSLSGLDNFSSVGHLSIRNNASLTSLSSLKNLTGVVNNLRIKYNDALTSLPDFENITSLTWLTISDNDVLTTLAGLDNLTSVNSHLSIEDNAALTSLSGLENLASVGGDLNINNNDTLTSVDALNNLISIGMNLYICENNVSVKLTPLRDLRAR